MRTNCIRRTSYIILYYVSNAVKVMKSKRREQNKHGKINIFTRAKEGAVRVT